MSAANGTTARKNATPAPTLKIRADNPDASRAEALGNAAADGLMS